MTDALLGSDRHLRIRVQQTLVASALMLVGGLCIVYLGWAGVVPQHEALAPRWLALMLLIQAGFLVAIRSGWSVRFADPALTEPQMLHGIVQTSIGYLLAGPARGACLLGILLSLMFGLFSLSTRRMWWMVAAAALSVGLTMLAGTAFGPRRVDPQVEHANFLFMIVSLPALGVVASRLNRLRERLRSQKQALTQALHRIERLAARDELTGLVNRRQMLELLAQQHQRSMRSGHGFCVAVLDLDHFKRVNDNHGHPVGDEVLRAFGRETHAVIRLGDVLARWGGEEFLLLMPDTAVSLARLAVERLREHHAGLRVRVAGAELVVTVSAGVTAHRSGEPVGDTIARADAALYSAKGNGRNQVVVL